MNFGDVSPPLVWGALFLVLAFIVILFLGWLRGRRRIPLFFPYYRREEIARKTSLAAGVLAVFLLFGFCACGIAVFGPGWGKKKIERIYAGKDIMFCVDISNSMTARDVGDGRLALAKVVVQNMISEYEEASFGITIYKGEGSVAVPLTQDMFFLQGFVESLHPGYSTVPGTNVEKGLSAAARGFSEKRPGKRYIFLISDGEGLEGNPFSSTLRDTLFGTEVWTFLSGTPGGGTVRMRDDNNIQTKADPDYMQRIAETYGGRYFDLGKDGWWERFTKAFSDEPQSGKGVGFTYTAARRYRFFLLLGAGFLLIYALLRSFIWKNIL